MKTLYSVLAIVSALALVGIVTSIGSHQIYAPRSCAGCVSDFKKLTNQFEKDILNAAVDDPNIIPSLIDQYSQDIKELFRTPSTSP